MRRRRRVRPGAAGVTRDPGVRAGIQRFFDRRVAIRTVKRFINRRRYVILALLLVIEALLGGVALASVFSESVRINESVRAALGLGFAVLAVPCALLMPPNWTTRLKVAAAVFASAFGLYVGILVPTDSHNTPTALLPTCSDVGNSSRGIKHATYYGAFRNAYEQAGAEPELGCPRDNDMSGYVHKWGEGYSQDLKGDGHYTARIMALSPARPVIILKGPLNRDYTQRFGPDTAPQIGYPITEPRQCGRAKVVHLDKGEWAPGVMITSRDPEKWIWLGRPFLERYRKLGGPLGPLGLPVDQAEITEAQPVQRFEGGTLYLDRDKGTVTSKIARPPSSVPAGPFPDCLAK